MLRVRVNVFRQMREKERNKDMRELGREVRYTKTEKGSIRETDNEGK